MATLFDLTGDLLRLQQMAEDEDVDPQALVDTMEGLQMEYTDKAGGYARIIFNLEADAEELRLAKKRLNENLDARIKSKESKAEALRKSLKTSMETTGLTEFEGGLWKFKIKKNPARLVIDDETKVPKKYLIPVQPKVDNAGIKKALTEGAKIKWAHMETSTRLEIK